MQTIVTQGPRGIRLKSSTPGHITVLGKNGVKTINLNAPAKVKFAA